MHRTVERHDKQDGYRYTARIELKLKRCRRRVDTFVSSARCCVCVWVCVPVCMGVIQIETLEAHVVCVARQLRSSVCGCGCGARTHL